MSMAEQKAALRQTAFAQRKAAHAEGHDAAAQAALRAHLSAWAGRRLAGYLPIRTEIDPTPVMAGWDAPVGVPVIEAAGHPLRFRVWRPDCPMVAGPFGVMIPKTGEEIVPEVVIVPLVAFDRFGVRLGYGGGFYDRTLAALRTGGELHAVGFAYSGQEVPRLPAEATDVRLDAVVTERGLLLPPPGEAAARGAPPPPEPA